RIDCAAANRGGYRIIKHPLRAVSDRNEVCPGRERWIAGSIDNDLLGRAHAGCAEISHRPAAGNCNRLPASQKKLDARVIAGQIDLQLSSSGWNLDRVLVRAEEARAGRWRAH